MWLQWATSQESRRSFRGTTVQRNHHGHRFLINHLSEKHVRPYRGSAKQELGSLHGTKRSRKPYRTRTRLRRWTGEKAERGGQRTGKRSGPERAEREAGKNGEGWKSGKQKANRESRHEERTEHIPTSGTKAERRWTETKTSLKLQAVNPGVRSLLQVDPQQCFRSGAPHSRCSISTITSLIGLVCDPRWRMAASWPQVNLLETGKNRKVVTYAYCVHQTTRESLRTSLVRRALVALHKRRLTKSWLLTSRFSRARSFVPMRSYHVKMLTPP